MLTGKVDVKKGNGVILLFFPGKLDPGVDFIKAVIEVGCWVGALVFAAETRTAWGWLVF